MAFSSDEDLIVAGGFEIMDHGEEGGILKIWKRDNDFIKEGSSRGSLGRSRAVTSHNQSSIGSKVNYHQF